ncbi:DUF6344 domain-containing protein [Streptomyces sp. NPDC058623]|uniref:DUF6344 domain-containing protein n=1 Tax=Streptomyces sp. NPDC058623 TaxID=3346563 RepID=UPI003664D708
MNHRSTVTSVWSTVLAALVALLGLLGLASKAAPVAAAAVAAPAVPAVRRPAVEARRTWRAMMRGGSLPPTIKQRIRAEAHGKTPSVRRSTTAAALAGNSGTAGAVRTGAGTEPAATVPSGPVAVTTRRAAGRGQLGLAA